MSGFIVTKFSRCTYQFIRVGKVHASIEAALAAATRVDRKTDDEMEAALRELLKSIPVPADELRKALEECVELLQGHVRGLEIYGPAATTAIAKARAALQQPALDETRIAIKDEAREEAAIIANAEKNKWRKKYDECADDAKRDIYYAQYSVAQNIELALRSLKGQP